MKVGYLITGSDAFVLQLAVVVIDCRDAPVVLNFGVPCIVIWGMIVFSSKESIHIVKGRIEQHYDCPIHLYRVVKIECICEALIVFRTLAMLYSIWQIRILWPNPSTVIDSYQ